MTWYVLCVAPSSEQSVAKRASERGFESYCPMMRTFDAKKASVEITRPLMPGYLFINDPAFDIFAPDYFENDRVESLPLQVYSGYVAECARPSPAPIRGCRGFVLWEGSPAIVRPSVIEDLRDREMRGEFDTTALTDNGRHRVTKWIKRAVIEGLPIQCVQGPFASFNGIIKKIKKSYLVTVEIHLFGCPTLVDMLVDWLRPVEDNPLILSKKRAKKVRRVSSTLDMSGVSLPA